MSPESPVDAPAKPVPEPTDVSRPFWDAFQEGRLVAQFCPACDRFQHYPKPLCERCWSAQLEWRTLSGTGTVYSFAVVHRGPSKEFADTPYVVGLVDLNEGIRMMARIDAPDAKEISIGDAVHVKAERRGEFVIPAFEKDA